MIIKYTKKGGFESVLNYSLCEDLCITKESFKADRSKNYKLVAVMISGKSYILYSNSDKTEVESVLDLIVKNYLDNSLECMI